MLSGRLSRNTGEIFFDIKWLRPVKNTDFNILTLQLKAETVIPVH